MSTPEPAEPSRGRTLAALLTALVCIAIGAIYVLRNTPADEPTEPPTTPPPKVAEVFELVAEPRDLPAGDDVLVYWRSAPVGRTPGPDVPFLDSFEVTTSAGADGRGAITGEQVSARIQQLSLPGKVVRASVRQVKLHSAPTAADGGPSVPVRDSARQSFSRMIRVDKKGRALLFVDVETWATGEPEPDCTLGDECRVEGRCGAKEGVCVAATDADCAKAKRCKASGACSAKDGKCVAGSDESCRASTACSARGACTLQDGGCGPGSQSDCEKSEACGDLMKGEICEFDRTCLRRVDPRFSPRSEADCKATRACKETGLCAYRAGACVASGDEACRASDNCSKYGHCTKKADKCAASSKADCQASQSCRSNGTCDFVDGACTATSAEHCKSSEVCKSFGWCELGPRGCAAPPEQERGPDEAE